MVSHDFKNVLDEGYGAIWVYDMLYNYFKNVKDLSHYCQITIQKKSRSNPSTCFVLQEKEMKINILSRG